MRKRIYTISKALAAAVLIVSLFSGCSISALDTQALMRPPRPTGERAQIHDELEKSAGGGLVLKYPSRGNYRSAVVMHDLVELGQEDAIAFYQKKGENAGLNVMFIHKEDGVWKTIGSFSNPASTVDEICFGDVNGDGRDEAVIGWGSNLNHSTAIYVYYYEDGQMQELKMDQSYTEMVVMDFDDDLNDEILTASVTVGDQPAVARLLRVKNGKPEIIGSANLDRGVTNYVNVAAGFISETGDLKGVVLDGSKSADMRVTEILYWDKDASLLRSPFYDSYSQTANYTARRTQAISQAVGGGKIIEIPIVTPLPGFTADTAVDETGYLTNFHRFNAKDNMLVRSVSMLMDYTDGYSFLVPDMWRGKVTTRMDAATRTLTFYEWVVSDQATNSGAMGAPLLRLRVFTEGDWADGKDTDGYYRIMESNSLMFAASIPSPDHMLSLNINDIKSGFKLIQTD
ncbi:FG-GAP repeat protein [Clostridium sp. D33t1_170424_F3]|uniref:FG-GAP repeat protein n=1 Tax=Clostridium sp. D33t1_170424_F3 TaxID=2787099 RepID=UPI0018AC5F95|nr:FG-GAP repeat protein [Clostridium sp. D33t1_170424_F3]